MVFFFNDTATTEICPLTLCDALPIFNVGDYRRELCGSQQPASFYDHSNAEALAQRNMACNAALTDMIEYIKQICPSLVWTVNLSAVQTARS